MSIESEVAALTAATTALLDTVNTKKVVLDAAASAADASASTASAAASAADASASTASAAASAADASAASAADASRLEIGTVGTLPAGSTATAEITGAPGSQVLNLEIPRGDPGATAGAAGSSGELQFNLAGEFAGLPGSSVSGSDLTLPGQLSVPASSAYTFTGRTDQGLVSLGSWGVGLQANGAAFFSTSLTNGSNAWCRGLHFGANYYSGDDFALLRESSGVAKLTDGSASSYRDLKARNLIGTVGGAQYLYNLDTDGSNHERGFARWNANAFEFGTENAGVGAARTLRFKVGTGYDVEVNSLGQVTAHFHNNSAAGFRTANGSGFGESAYNSGMRLWVDGTKVGDWTTSLLTFDKPIDVAGFTLRTPTKVVQSYSTDSTENGTWTFTADNAHGQQILLRPRDSAFGGGSIRGVAHITPNYTGAIGNSAAVNLPALQVGEYGPTLYHDSSVNNDGVLAIRGGHTPQTLRIYNDYTDGSNYERGFVRWAASVLQIGHEKAGTGTARNLEIQTDGTTRMTVASDGARVGIGVSPGSAGVSLSLESNLSIFNGWGSLAGTTVDGHTSIWLTSPRYIQIGSASSAYGIILTNLPTSASGLQTGQVWNDGGTLKIA